MTTLGHRMAVVELDDITREVADLGAQAQQLAERLEAVRSVLAGDVLDLRDRPREKAGCLHLTDGGVSL